MNESKNKTRQIRKKRISTEDIIDYINWSLITDNMKMIKNSSLINVQKLYKEQTGVEVSLTFIRNQKIKMLAPLHIITLFIFDLVLVFYRFHQFTSKFIFYAKLFNAILFKLIHFLNYFIHFFFIFCVNDLYNIFFR